MKNFTQKFIGLSALLFTISFNANSQEIGDIYEGGYVFQINEDGTGLVADISDLGVSLPATQQYMWDQAIDVVVNSSSQGYNDWRLPNIEELELMYNTIGLGGPHGNIGGFIVIPYPYYWSSLENVSNSSQATSFSFNSGHPANSWKHNTAIRTRAIRSVTFGQEMVYTECGPDEYESLAPTSNTDRECSALSICSADEYELVPATATSDRICGVAQDDVQEDVQIYSNYFNISAGGYHNLAIRPDGTVEAWGWGNGAEGTQTGVPENLTDVIQVSAFYHHASMALLKDGTVVGWGNNSNGQLDIPENLEQIVQISTGGVHILALHPDGTVSAWGWNGWGESNVPEGLENVVSVSGGWRHSVAVHSDGTVSAWGYNADGQCNVPSGLTGVVSAKAGKYNTIALLDDGTVISWGNPPSGYVFPTNLSDVIAINAGFYHGIALKSDGSVVTWGRNTDGQLNIPQNIDNVVAIDAGHRNSLLLLSDGSVVNIGNTGHPNGYSVQNIPEGLVVLVYGCTDSSAYNYDANANRDDNSCVAVVNGCTDSSAFNFDANANTDDGSCISWEEIANNLQSELDNVVIEDGIGQSDLDAAVEQAYAEGAASVTPEDGIGQADVDAAYAAGAVSVTPEDGVSQADVDAAFTNGVASVEVPECEEVSTQNIPIDLPQGWSMFGYTCLDSVDAATGFSEIADQIEIVKDEWGLSYLPSWDFNALGGLHYSEGYQIKMKEAVTDFQFCTTIAGGVSQEELNAAYDNGAASVTPEDGISQSDVDAVQALLDAIIPEDGIGQADVDLAYEAGLIDGDDGVSQADVDAAYTEGAASVTPEDGITQADIDAVHASYEGWLAPIYGCTGPDYCNYNHLANTDDGSCVYAQEGYDCDGNYLIQIGGQYAGGIVFQINEDGTGLVADLQDLGKMDWFYAMDAAASATSQGYEDWYIPSIEELELMFNTIGHGADNSGNFENSEYWSSSDFHPDFTWIFRFDYREADSGIKGSASWARVIRAF